MKHRKLWKPSLLLLLGLLMITAQPLSYAITGVTSVSIINGYPTLWHQTYGGANHDYAHSIAVCREGGFVIAGSTASSGAGYTDMWLVRTDEAGNHLWNRTYGGTFEEAATGVIECQSGGFAMTGYTRSFPQGRHNAWLVRTDPLGNLLWNRSFGGYDTDNALTMIEVRNGGFAILGATRSYGSVDDFTQIRTFNMWIIRTDGQGNMLWNESYGGTGDDIGRYIHETGDGGFLITGEINGNYDALSMGGLIEYQSDAWLLKIDAQGNQEWNRTFGGPNNDFSRSVMPLADGRLLIAGFTESYGAGNYDGWIITTNQTGLSPVNTTVGGPGNEYFRSIIPCGNDGIAFAGWAYSLIDDSSDLWLVRHDSQGNYLWSRTFGGVEDDLIRQGIRVDDGFAMVGYTSSFGAGKRDVWLVYMADIPPVPVMPPLNTLGIIVLVVGSGIVVIVSSIFLWKRQKT